MDAIIQIVVALVQAGQQIAGPVEATVKALIGFISGPDLTEEQIDTAFAQVLADDLVIQALAAAQSGGDAGDETK